MATLDTIASRVLNNLDRAGAPTTESDLVKVWVNQSIREDICADVNFACMEFELNTWTTINQDVIDVPTLLNTATSGALLKDIDMVRFSLGDGYNYSVLPEVDERVLFERFSDTTTGSPEAWARTGEKIRIRPVADKTGNATTNKVQIRGWMYLPDLATGSGATASNDISNRHERLLEMSVTSRGLLYYGEYEKAQYYNNLYQYWYQRAINGEKRRKAPANLVMRPSPTAGKPASPVSPWKWRRGPDYGWMS
jgi:hypothetical protein